MEKTQMAGVCAHEYLWGEGGEIWRDSVAAVLAIGNCSCSCSVADIGSPWFFSLFVATSIHLRSAVLWVR